MSNRNWFMMATGIAWWLLLLLPFFTAPALASGSAAVFISPDQVLPSETENIDLTITNNEGWTADDVYITVPGSTAINIAGATPTPYGENSTHVEYGHYCSGDTCGLGFASGTDFTAHLEVTTGATFAGSDWGINLYQWNSSGALVNSAAPSGNVTETVTSAPNATVESASTATALDNPQSSSLNTSGVGDPVQVKGLLAPGPIDSILTLPITMLGIVIDRSSVSVSPVTLDFFGNTGTLGSGGEFWDGIGSTATDLISSIAIFFMLYLWIKSLFHRLERATSLSTTAEDTWGVL